MGTLFHAVSYDASIYLNCFPISNLLSLCFYRYGALKNYAQGGDTGKQLTSAEYLELAAISSELVNGNVVFANCRKNEIDDSRSSLAAVWSWVLLWTRYYTQ